MKRPHDDDVARRAYFAGLADANKENLLPATELAKLANKHYKVTEQPKLATRTAQTWLAEYRADPAGFCAGPKYCTEGNKRLTDQEVMIL